AVFKTAPFVRSGTPPRPIVAGEASDRSHVLGLARVAAGARLCRAGGSRSPASAETASAGSASKCRAPARRGGGSRGNQGFPRAKDRSIRPLWHPAFQASL